MAETTPKTAPADRKKAAPSAAEKKKQEQALSEFLASGVDFEPFIIDAGDGVEWRFNPDPMPGSIAQLRASLVRVEAAESATDLDALDAAFGDVVGAIRSLLLDEAQRDEFPRPNYGMRALTFFALHLTAGKTGLPTEPA